MSKPSSGNPTARLEAFSDGVFSIAITVLVFNILVPRNLPPDKPLITALLELWPSYLGYLLGFFLIGIMWMNHHNLFKLVGRSTHMLMVFNGLLLLTIALVPFTSALLAEYLPTAQAQTATLVFNGWGFFVALFYNLLWQYMSHKRRVIHPDVDQKIVDAISSTYRFGPVFYLIAMGATLFGTFWGIAVNIGLAIFFALPLNAKLFEGD
jgi:uncharacterized membrane protein